MRSIIKHFLALAFLFVGFQVHAKGSCKEGRDKPYSFKKMKAELNLTAEQLQQLEGVSKKMSKEIIKQKRKAMEEAQAALNSALKSEASDEQIRAQFDELQKRQEDFSRTRFEKILKVRSVLTAEQKNKFKTIFDKK